jgi:sugar lactone lactonase YvrE
MGRELPAFTPRYLLTVASVEARLGHKQEALQWLGKFAATGLSFDLAKDDDLKLLLSEEGGQKIAAQMKESSKPVSKAELVCALSQADIMPEDLTYVKSSNTFIVSSIQHHTLYRVSLPKPGTKECAVQELPLPPEAKRWPTLAVSVDSKRKALWVTASAMPDFSGFPKEDEGKALLLEIDEAGSKVLRSFDPGTTSAAVLGDMSVAEDGTVYVTDSIGGGVYRLRGDPQTAKLEKIADGLFSPQTPVLARDGKRLFVADYSLGIAVIDLTAIGPASKVTYLPHPENVAVVTLDGLFLSGDSLIGIQNGIEPARIMRFRLNHAQTEITAAEVIEQSERMGDPTHVIAADGWFYVSANVGWSKVDDAGKLKPGESFTAPVLLRFR